MLCEMCSSSAVAFKIEVEGSRLSVCEKCSKYGKVLSKVEPEYKHKESVKAPSKVTETVQVIRTDYADQIKRSREKLGLTQGELARRLLEKESLLQKIESGHMKPDIALARKLEKSLKITLVEQVELTPGTQKSEKNQEDLTIGDLIKAK